MARKSILATLVGIAAFAVPTAFADKGGIPHAGSNGKGSSAAQAQGQAQSQEQSHGQAKANGHAKTHVKSQVKVQAKGHAYAKGHTQSHSNTTGQSQGHAYAKGQTKVKTHGRPATGTTGTPTANTHAKAGKTTICHATGSATNPFVTITISNNALPAHRRHQDGRDIIPAPQGGGPGTSSQTQHPPVGSEQQGGQQNSAGPNETQSTTGATGQVQGQTLSGSTQTPTTSTGSGTTSPSGAVLGTSTSGSAPSASNTAAATATRASSSSKLPFTGTDAIIVAILGLAALLVGVSVRRAATHRAKA